MLSFSNQVGDVVLSVHELLEIDEIWKMCDAPGDDVVRIHLSLFLVCHGSGGSPFSAQETVGSDHSVGAGGAPPALTFRAVVFLR